MKKMMVGLALVLTASMFVMFPYPNVQIGYAMMGSGMDSGMGWGQGYGSQPPDAGSSGSQGSGAYGMGSGMMGGGYGMGSGMMGGGYGMGSGTMGPGYQPSPQYPNNQQQQQLQKPIDKTQAESMVKNYLRSSSNPNLKLGKITDQGSSFEADIVTKDNSLVDKILVDKDTGAMRSAY
jgi:hypothetical protein